MYGNSVGLPSAGVVGGMAFGTAAVSYGASVLACIAITLLVCSVVMIVVNHRRRAGSRP